MSSTFTKIELGKWMDKPFAFLPEQEKMGCVGHK